jgi:hypothetical protein
MSKTKGKQMELKANDVRAMLATKEPVDAVFLVPLAGDEVGAMMIKSIDAGESPMVIAREYSGNERCLSWKTVCDQYEIVTG